MEHEEGVAGSSDFGGLLRRYRLRARLSQEALAERAKMSANGIGALERGYRRTPQRETLALLADALALSDEQRQEFEAAASRQAVPRRGVPVTVGPWTDLGVATLPLSLGSFVGREAELDEIAGLVSGHRLVTITGAGGVGKTQTALRVAASLGASDAITVSFVALAPLRDSSSVTATIAVALRVQELQNRSLLETLVSYLKNKTLLLILDNCEHVIAEIARVANALLAFCPGLRILATSREPLKTAGEFCYRLPSLSAPPADRAALLTAGDATAYGAIALFYDRARSADHHYHLADDLVAPIAELCRRLDGIPLAIELAAARVKVLSIQSLVEKLQDRFRILTGGDRMAPPRQQTMRATIDWSYSLLDNKEQRVFERLSIFASGCALESAIAVCAGDDVTADEILDVLTALVDKSLVNAEINGTECRYRLLESFRQFAAERLTAVGQQELISRRFALACFDLAQQLNHSFEFGPEHVWRTMLDAELHNWRAALAWCLSERRDVERGQRLAAQLRPALGFFVADGRLWLDLALELVDEQTPRDLLAELYSARARVAEAYRDCEAALRYNEAALLLFGSASDPFEIAWAQFGAGWSLRCVGRHSEARDRLQEALLVRKHGNCRVVGCSLRHLGVLSIEEHDFAAARNYNAEAMKVFRELGQSFEIAWCEWQLGDLAMYEGNPEAALQTDLEVLETFRRFNFHARGTMFVLNHATARLIVLGRYDESLRYADEALDLVSENGPAVTACLLESVAAAVALRDRDEKTAEDSCAKAARLLGFAQVQPRESPRSRSWWQDQHIRAIDTLRNSMGRDAVARCIVEGGMLTEEEAAELARSLCTQKGRV
ncbi:MAG: helix-turn-helix domain-containing protein [Candidatus Cybelea sp.]